MSRAAARIIEALDVVGFDDASKGIITVAGETARLLSLCVDVIIRNDVIITPVQVLIQAGRQTFYARCFVFIEFIASGNALGWVGIAIEITCINSSIRARQGMLLVFCFELF